MLRTSKIGALVRTCSAGKFPAFTFITPLFGVLASYFILHEPLTLAFAAAALLVIAGLYLVNRPNPTVPLASGALLTVTKT
jgi:drug/metabolite transporter (DMT)-like permease